MVKLASARECRMYGPRLSRNRAEYINAGLYLFATIVLVGGFVAELLSKEPKSGLVLLLIGFVLIMTVNLHDLFAHLAGFDYRFGLMSFDTQLALVEFAVPLPQALGALLFFMPILFLFIQEEERLDHFKWEKHALNTLIAGPILWVLGSILNACQKYERADGHTGILQESVHIPFLMGSFMFLVAAILNTREHTGFDHHGVELLGKTWVWMGILGSLLIFVGGLINVVKVFKMQQIEGLRLEKLQRGAQERLMQEREGQVPLIPENQLRRKRIAEETKSVSVPIPTPYKDVLVGEAAMVSTAIEILK